MKNLVLIVALVLISCSLSAQDSIVYDNFDEEGKVSWIFFDNNQGGSFDAAYLNPSTGGINSSLFSGKIYKAAGADEQFFFFLEKPWDLSGHTRFSMLLYGRANTEVNVKLQYNDLNYEAALTEVKKSYTLQNDSTWELAVFDFSDASSREDLNKLVIDLNVPVDEEETLLIDDLRGPVFYDTVKLTYGYAYFDSTKIMLKFNEFLADPDTIQGFSLKVNDVVVPLQEAFVLDTFAKEVVLVPESPFLPGDEISLSYHDGNLRAKTGWPVQEFTGKSFQNGAGKDTVMVWSDEFNDPTLDTTVWTRLASEYWFNEESQAYTNSPRNSYIEEGKLKITARKENFGIREFTSARIVSRYNADFRYGRIEARMKMPEGQGIWPAFWMMPTEDFYGSWPSSGEIDIMEFLGHQLNYNHGAVHYGDGLGKYHEQQHDAYYNNDVPRNGNFHVYALEWEPGVFRWFFDSIKFHTASAKNTKHFWPFQKDFHFILNVAVGGRWPGQPDETTVFPQSLEVDYVRVYKYRKVPETKPQEPMIIKGVKELKVNVYPNPVKSNQHVYIKPVPDQDYTACIYTLDGNTKFIYHLPAHSNIIPVKNLEKGFYLVQINAGKWNSVSKLIIN